MIPSGTGEAQIVTDTPTRRMRQGARCLKESQSRCWEEGHWEVETPMLCLVNLGTGPQMSPILCPSPPHPCFLQKCKEGKSYVQSCLCFCLGVGHPRTGENGVWTVGSHELQRVKTSLARPLGPQPAPENQNPSPWEPRVGRSLQELLKLHIL